MQFDRVTEVIAKYGRRRWVQLTTVGLLLVLVGWIALRAESTAAEERVLAEFTEVVDGLNQITKKEAHTGGISAVTQPDTATVDELRGQAKRASNPCGADGSQKNLRKRPVLPKHRCS